MTITNFSIYFNQDVYHPGQMVSGKVVVALDKPKTIKGVELKIKGRTKFHWDDQESYTDSEGKTQYRTIKREGKESYFKSNMTLIGGKGDFELTIGEHTYPFSVMLPANVPSSFSGKYGGVQYYGKAKVDIPWAIDKHQKKYFLVENLLNLSLFPHLKESAKDEKSKSFCCLCCASGPLTIVIYVPKTGFAKHEPIPVTVEVDNASNVAIAAVKAQLKRKIHWKASGDSKNEKDTIKTIYFGDVAENSSKTWSENMPLESEHYPNLTNCHIIDITYKLEIEADAEGMHSDLEISVPITIGDIAFNEGENTGFLQQGPLPFSQGYPPEGGQQLPMATVPTMPMQGYLNVAGMPNAVPGIGFNSSVPSTYIPPGGVSVPEMQAPYPGSVPGATPGMLAPYSGSGPIIAAPYPGAAPEVSELYPGSTPAIGASYPSHPGTVPSSVSNTAVTAPYPSDVNVNASVPYSTFSNTENPSLAMGDGSQIQKNLFNSNPVEMPHSGFLSENKEHGDHSSKEEIANQFTPLLPPPAPSAPSM